jgi:hypothetical protein
LGSAGRNPQLLLEVKLNQLLFTTVSGSMAHAYTDNHTDRANWQYPKTR